MLYALVTIVVIVVVVYIKQANEAALSVSSFGASLTLWLPNQPPCSKPGTCWAVWELKGQ